jgi:phage tail sheath protein FI
MPVAVSYPGVYIEEVPSGVHTITGVATSITAFIGFTSQGPVDHAVELFTFADFERAFGGLSADSPLSYSVRQFYDNGGGQSYVVRVADGASSASMTLPDVNGNPTIKLIASSAGLWGNNLVVTIDTATSAGSNYFNLTVTEYVDKNGVRAPNRSETFRNQSLNPTDAGYILGINSVSKLISVDKASVTGLAVAGNGSVTSGVISNAIVAGLGAVTLGISQNGGPTTPVTAGPSATIAVFIPALNAALGARIGGGIACVPIGATQFVITAGVAIPPAASSIRVADGAAARALRLTAGTGATILDAVAASNPKATGTLSGPLSTASFTFGAGDHGLVILRITDGINTLDTAMLQLWGAAPAPLAPPNNPASLASLVTSALGRIPSTKPLFRGTTVAVIGNQLRVAASLASPALDLRFAEPTPAGTDTTATTLGLVVPPAAINFAGYAAGEAVAAPFSFGADGTTPTTAAPYSGDPANKTGLYALEDVDLFNLLCVPEISDKAFDPTDFLTEAIGYCEKRRALVLLDLPPSVQTRVDAEVWLGTTGATLRRRNAAAFWPRFIASDPLQSGASKSYAPSGAVAGLFARTDADRGVWKAPAGTTASIQGAINLDYKLTNDEQGTLNPLALNCLRSFPVFGIVSWGSRTMMGADALADDYKYIPVRRLALFLEESLYRGTQWVVFEPNDEPLWAQIRLNIGAFMHLLFAQGAFAGQTPRDAYFVKCDKDTTTLADVDLGRVNIVVGFAPLKPAEFVIIQIRQIVPALAT